MTTVGGLVDTPEPEMTKGCGIRSGFCPIKFVVVVSVVPAMVPVKVCAPDGEQFCVETMSDGTSEPVRRMQLLVPVGIDPEMTGHPICTVPCRGQTFGPCWT